MIRSLIPEDAGIVHTYIFAWASALFRSYKDRQCEGLKTWERTASAAPRFFCIPTSDQGCQSDSHSRCCKSDNT